MKRSCEECTACCSSLAVDEIHKKAGNKCYFVCSAGCEIYSTRPSSCKNFECEWLKGKFSEEDRPDKSGVIFTLSDRRSQLGKRSLIAHETKIGSLLQAKPLLNKIAENELVICVSGQSRKFIGPREDIDRVNDIISKQRRQ